MTEEFLHYLWKFKNFKTQNLTTAEGEKVEILQSGIHNHDAGPDFSNARIRIGDQLWAGNVEIHISSSDWNKHNHHKDTAYQSIILHVVYNHDKEIRNNRGSIIPTIALQGLFDEYLYWRYEQLLHNQTVIPCAGQLTALNDFIKESMLERVLLERLEHKSGLVHALLKANNHDWNTTFYQWMSRGYGLKVNAEPMLILAQNIPLSILMKHKDHLFQLEALLFGVSGMNKDPEDAYARKLKEEFDFLKKKFGLSELDAALWKFSRLRPAAFPTLRLAQFAALIHKSENLFSEILSIGDIEKLRHLLGREPSSYWTSHYRFSAPAVLRNSSPGDNFINILIINVIVPFLFVYGQIKDEAFYRQRAMDILDQLHPENNRITRAYKEMGFPLYSAFHSQAVLQLQHCYCEPKKCLNCAIGTHLLKN